MLELTDEQRHALAERPIEVTDQRTKRVFYLLSQEQYQRVRILLESEWDPREMYPLIAKTAAEAGWNDSTMDAYDNYDEHRQKH
jgi:hypothetical protein